MDELENSMAVDMKQITIPMSINDFARRERFKVAISVIEEAVRRLYTEAIDTDWTEANEETLAAIQARVEAHVTTLQNVIKVVNEDEDA